MTEASTSTPAAQPRKAPQRRPVAALLATLCGLGALAAAAFASSLLHPLFLLVTKEPGTTALGFLGLAVLALAATLMLALSVTLLGLARVSIARFRGNTDPKRQIIPWTGAAVAFSLCAVLTLFAGSTVMLLGEWIAGLGIVLGALPAVVFAVMAGIVAVRRGKPASGERD